MKKYFRPLVITAIVFIYLIIIAGAVVRMTGSGMGCPDWPKCFGYIIPPTEAAQIQWKPNHEYKEGTIIIFNEALKVAHRDFKTTETFTASNWSPYTKHDYAKFNVWHTWIEYINRLVTVLSGIPILLMIACSFFYVKEDKRIVILSFLTLIAMAFQAWLGKEVVDSNLLPYKITIHMVMAFIILAILLLLLFLVQRKQQNVIFPPLFKNILAIAVILTLVQVALGTQVRQYVDEQVKLLGEHSKSQWLHPPTLNFYIHRSFSIVVTLVNIWLFYKNRKLNLELNGMNWVMILIGLEVVTGILMYYFDFPFLSQPLHLVLSSLLFGVQFYLLLNVYKPKKAPRAI
ncbi:COX15/CtaA family protein [Aquimarina brevivitae]|uniref:Cytochrome c oxidase assembly protein subunit 15 n=1 Tax=Aquimarina brevivitae TaxID=323412 RepID=A0A4V2F7M5_9FLAO|nr:COX15/CtaA family protein [Aquimarina brevivitae]RZT00340.1 cytochrome c oxidase assembly protein subunit 15 [Aquimarina brevivitae]